MRKTNGGYTKMIVKILNILNSDADDAQIFSKISSEIMSAYPFIDKSSFWIVKSDGEHYITGIGYEHIDYSSVVIPLEDSLSAVDPEEDVKIINSGYFPEGFPQQVKASILASGIKENSSKTLQVRLKPFGDYFGVLCFDVLDYSDQFTNEIMDELAFTADAIRIFLEMRITLNNKKKENLYRDHLVASISHDVRTPLTVIMGYIELMQSLIKDEQISNFLNIMEEQSNYLLNIISDLITLSKINSGNYTITEQKTNIRELINNLIKGLKILAKKKRLKLTVQIAANIPTFTYIDRRALKKIINNLVSNAIKYTDEGQVQVDCKIENKDYLKFVVSDTGPGIPEEKLTMIFDRYTREQRTMKKPGSGLGLSICKELTEELSGSIWAESKLNKGSQFHLLLPLNPGEINLIKTEKKESKKVSLTGKHFLILEDDQENRHMYELVLKNAGAVCYLFNDPDQALKECRIRMSIDYILVDLLLSSGSSLDFIAQIKQHFPKKIIIAITGSSDQSIQLKALEAGASIVLLKPFSLKELCESITE